MEHTVITITEAVDQQLQQDTAATSRGSRGTCYMGGNGRGMARKDSDTLPSSAWAWGEGEGAFARASAVARRGHGARQAAATRALPARPPRPPARTRPAVALRPPSAALRRPPSQRIDQFLDYDEIYYSRIYYRRDTTDDFTDTHSLSTSCISHFK